MYHRRKCHERNSLGIGESFSRYLHHFVCRPIRDGWTNPRNHRHVSYLRPLSGLHWIHMVPMGGILTVARERVVSSLSLEPKTPDQPPMVDTICDLKFF